MSSGRAAAINSEDLEALAAIFPPSALVTAQRSTAAPIGGNGHRVSGEDIFLVGWEKVFTGEKSLSACRVNLAYGLRGLPCKTSSCEAPENPRTQICGYRASEGASPGVVALMKSFRAFKPEDVERMLLNATEGRRGGYRSLLPSQWYPSLGFPGVLCVTATHAEEPLVLARRVAKLASLGVPGTEMMSLTPECDGDEWLYGMFRGSSGATAGAAGIVALMKSFKAFKPEEVERMLLNATEGRVKTEDGDEMTYGVLRPDLAVDQAIAEARLSPQRRS
ncbi:hypothetical protein FOZ60_003786 [Perkinsus olseni]|uniref:subtilisin n=1 Tax=Perkinsus olseni TaxID=32597 RepID=A0A7J6NUU1_PEROL|nr:hypothetical protein FOZ60_003786 [Perkinsus olseni]